MKFDKDKTEKYLVFPKSLIEDIKIDNVTLCEILPNGEIGPNLLDNLELEKEWTINPRPE